MSEPTLRTKVIDVLVHQMGYTWAEALMVTEKHAQRLERAERFLPRRLAMQIEREQCQRAMRVSKT
jgi:hypothetical protein